jgi:opacity protein-like surface antigen
MFKKIVTASAIIAMSSTTAFAGAAPYVGADLGINTLTSSSGTNYRGIPLNIFAGYGSTINTNLYMGGEIFLTPFTGRISSAGGNGLRTTYSYGVDILPGVMFSDHTLGYLRAGVVRTHFTSGSQNKTGGQLGLGIQTNMTQYLDIRTEYVFTAYSKVQTSSSPRSDAFKVGLIYKFE